MPLDEYNLMKNKIIPISIILAVNLALVILSYNYVSETQYQEIKDVKYKDINYDIRSKDPNVSSIKEYLEDFSWLIPI